MRSAKPGNHLKQHKRHAFWFVSVELFKVKKYPQRRKILVKIFVSELNLKGLGKLEKVLEKVMKFEQLKRVRTLCTML